MRWVAGAALAVVLLAGCGGAKDARRSQVNDYVKSVNKAEHDALVPWRITGNAYAALSRGTLSPQELRDLAAAPKTIRSLRARVAAVPAPADAKPLRASLLHLLDLDARFAEEVDVFARYLHDVDPLEKELGTDTTQLRAELKRAHKIVPEQVALARYAARLDTLLTRFRRLQPPPALAPWNAEQQTRIATFLRGARELGSGLLQQDAALTQRGLTELTNAAAASGVTQADRTAILAYDKRLKRVQAAAAAVAREQSRLTRELT